jgi:hypothetical protein
MFKPDLRNANNVYQFDKDILNTNDVYYGVTECDELNLGLFKMPAKYQGALNAYFSMMSITIY